MKKIIVLGGAGDMGSRAVEDLAGAPDIERVTVADRNLAAASKLAAKLRGSVASVDAKSVDATDHEALVATMRGYDVAASALGPFYRFEAPLIRAAIEAGVDYASICDDYSAAEAALELDEAAREAGRTVITGLGTSPGLSNLLIRYLGREMDPIRRADVYVYQPLNAGGGQAVIKHMLYIISGKVTAWRGGKRVMVRACSEERTVEFPHFGRIKTWNMGHAEPVTVPRFIPDVEECSFFMGFGRGSALFIQPARWGLFGSDRRIDWTARLFAPIERLTAGQEPAPGALRVDVWGEVDGVEAHRTACGVGKMREATALSLSVGTQMLARKELSVAAGGVYAPEACFDPAPFVAAMRAKGVEAFEDAAMTRPLA